MLLLIDKQLSVLLDGYNKKNIKFEKFEPRINQAIDRAKKFYTANEELLT